MIKELTILGFRGFLKKQTVYFSCPDSKRTGSGLNILVGPNNSGKSSIIESIKAFNGKCSFSIGKRNNKADNRVFIELKDDQNITHTIETSNAGGSEVQRINADGLLFFTLPSRRYFSYEFSKSESSKQIYISAFNKLVSRNASLEGYNSRLFQMLKNKEKIDSLIHEVIHEKFDWTIDQNDSGQYFVRLIYGNITHTAEGVGDGIWSIFTICDTLYDSKPGDTIVIDEPELSLHPAYQKRLLKILIRYSIDRQIIISTHSPYFVDWKAIENGAGLIRCVKEKDYSINVYSLTDETRKIIGSFLFDINNPHVLGLEANEVFFLEDQIIITEGQEDVLALNKITSDNSINLDGNIFGWGCGGASKEDTILSLLSDLGFKKVVAIFDGDKENEYLNAKKKYPQYHFEILPTNDIRDKVERNIPAKDGLCTTNLSLKDEFKEAFNTLTNDINNYFSE